MDPRQSPRYIGEVPIPALPDPADYDLGLTSPTYFEAFRIFVPWIDFAQRGAGLPADFQINGPEPVDGDPRTEEHTSELQSLMRTPYPVSCLNTKKECSSLPP